eukprot:4570222-Prymnesium_polylepis.1
MGVPPIVSSRQHIPGKHTTQIAVLSGSLDFAIAQGANNKVMPHRTRSDTGCVLRCYLSISHLTVCDNVVCPETSLTDSVPKIMEVEGAVRAATETSLGPWRLRRGSRAHGTSMTTRLSPGSSPPLARLAPLAPPCGTAA